MKIIATTAVLAALLPSSYASGAALRGAQAPASIERSLLVCNDMDWTDENGNGCDYHEQMECARGNMDGAFGLTANTACCGCGGGWEEGEPITTAVGWQFFRHDAWIWDIAAIELYSSSDCSQESRLDVAGAAYPESGHHDDWSPDKPFRDSPGTWGGRWDEVGGSLHLGIEFPTAKTVQCIKFRQRTQDAGPILIRSKETPTSPWKNVMYIADVPGSDWDAPEYETFKIGKGEVSRIDPLLCDDNHAVMIFSGHDSVESINEGAINVTWSPAFVYHFDETEETNDKFVDCGDYTYTVVVAEGDVTFTSEETNSDIVHLANNDPSMQVITTTDRNLYLTNLNAGESYSVLVLAKSESGSESLNRSPALVRVSQQDPELKDGFERMLVMPEPTEAWTVNMIQEGDSVRLLVVGNFPSDYEEISAGDFITVFGDDGVSEANSKILKAVSSLSSTGNQLEWLCEEKQLSDIFIELDASYDVNEESDGLDGASEVDLQIDDETLEAMIEALPDKVKIDICILVDGVEDLSCFDSRRNLATTDRRLFLKKIGQAFKKVYHTAKKVVTTVRDVAVTAVEAVSKLSATLDKTITFLDIEKSAKLTCRNSGKVDQVAYSSKFQAGVQFDLNAKARFQIRISVSRGLDNASLRLFGGFGAAGYVKLGATAKAKYLPDALTLFEKTHTKVFFAGYVPIVITNRPKLEAYVKAEMAVEADALYSAQIGWDYELGFEYDGKKPADQKFQVLKSFTKRDNTSSEDPEFNLRVKAQAQLGLQFSWDIILYGTLQATVATDVGLNGTLAVGTNLDAIVVTPDYPVTLDDFNLEAYLAVHVKFGFAVAISDIIRKFVGEITPTCTFTTDLFSVPSLLGDTVGLDGPPGANEVVDALLHDPTLTNAVGVTLDLLAEKGVLSDAFRQQLSLVNSASTDEGKPLQLQWTVFKETFPLVGLPEISVGLTNVATCQGNNAIALQFETTGNDKILDGEWFGNFDGSLTTEDSDWRIDSNGNPGLVTVTLPRSSTADYAIEEGMELILRSTPKVLPFVSKSLFNEVDVFGLANVESFECCEDSDCQLKFGTRSTCGSDQMCQGKEDEGHGGSQNDDDDDSDPPSSDSVLIINKDNTWFENHERLAVACGGHLASLHNEGDRVEIETLFELGEVAHHSVFYGAKYNRETESWYWLDGSNFDYERWDQSYDTFLSDSTGDWIMRGICSDPNECKMGAMPLAGFVMPGAYRLPVDFRNKDVYPTCDTDNFVLPTSLLP